MSEPPLPAQIWENSIVVPKELIEDEPIEGVVVDHPIPQTHVGFDVGPGGQVFVGTVNSTIENGEWKLVGFTDCGVSFDA